MRKMLISREIQKEILELLAEKHPVPVRQLTNTLNLERSPLNNLHETQVVANCEYLRQHGLIESGFKLSSGLSETNWLEAGTHRITARGIDFLLDDGGLGAILGVVTVKLDRSTVSALMCHKIDSSQNLTHDEKSRLKSKLNSLGDRAFEKLLDKLIESGLEALPSAQQLADMIGGLFG